MDTKEGIWMSMLGNEMFIRRDVNGKITHYIHVDGGATACALGGDDGRTLYLVINKVPEGEMLFDAMVGRWAKSRIFTVDLHVPKGSKARP